MQRTDERSLLAQQKPGLVLFETPEINAETPAHLLDSDITPLEALFVRNTGTTAGPGGRRGSRPGHLPSTAR